MDDRTRMPERAWELAELQRRAYGPDADIATDPDAVARLELLEESFRVRPPSPVADSTVSVDAQTDPPLDVGVDEAQANAACDEPEVAPRRLWTRVPAWALAFGSLVVGLLAGASVVWAIEPRPDAVLRASSDAEARDSEWRRELQSWGISSDSATEYETFNGVGVWTATSQDDSRCIILESGERPVSATCVGAGFDPILDLTMYGGMDDVFTTAPPPGSVIRFIARADAVEVWVRERQPIDSWWMASSASRR